MPTPVKGARMGGSPSHQRHMLANLASQLIEHKSIRTTETRAKRLRPVVERLITIARKGDLNARRRVARTLRDKSIVYELVDVVAPKMEGRPGGYTRITKLGNRKGDNAPMAQIELIFEELSPKKAAVKEAEKVAAKAADEPAEEATQAATDAEVEEVAQAVEELEEEAGEK